MGAIRGRLPGGLAAAVALLAASSPSRSQVPAGPVDANGARELNCLTAALYYEARGEGPVGEAAVAQVVLNRRNSPAYPKSVCAVVYQGAPLPGCQFTFACDGSLGRPLDAAAWRQAATVAGRALAGEVVSMVGGATHYHTLSVHPVWEASMQPTLTLGRHRFFRAGGIGPGLFAANRTSAATAGAPAPAAPHSATFAVWGLQVALVRPEGAGVDVSSSLPPPPPGGSASATAAGS